MSELLEGLKVLELGAGSTGTSLAGMLLADGGARVVKVEPPSGDRFRTSHESGFLIWNRGKESLVLDLRTAEGQERFRELAGGADVVLDGLAPGRAASWGIGYDDLCGINTGLVYTTITGFGVKGDYARFKGYDPIVAAKSGFYSRGMYSFREGPTYYPVPWGGFSAGMQAVAGTLAALRVRTTAGVGQRVDASLLAGLDSYDFYGTPSWQLAVRRGDSAAAADTLSVTGASRYAIMVCSRDGRFIQTPTMMPAQAKALTAVAGLEALLDDPDYADMPKFPTPELAQLWEDALLEAFRGNDAEYWVQRLTENGNVPFEVAITSEEALENAQYLHNGDVITVSDPQRGPIRQVGPIGHFRDTPVVIDRSAPAIDSHGQLWDTTSRNDTQAATTSSLPESPLSGVTIVEFGAFYAMPYALAMLASMGARVIKIEDASGDPARQSFGPEVLTFKTTGGKESISLNMRDERSQELVREILSTADVFVVGYRPGVVEKFGLGYDRLREANKKLIFVQATGYGADGPNAARPLYGPAASAVAGAYGRQVSSWSRPEMNEGMSVLEIQVVVLPRLTIIQDGDANGALGLMAAISMALHHQLATGNGQYLLTSMIASNAWAYADDFCRYEGKVPVPVADEDYLGLDALHRVYETADGWVCLHVDTAVERRQLGLALDIADALSNAILDLTVDGELARLIGGRLRTESAKHWEALMQNFDVACVEVFGGGQSAFTSSDPVLRSSGRTVEVPHPLYSSLIRAAPPVDFSRHAPRVGANCMRGEHNDSLLEEFGRDDATRAEWIADGVLFPADPDVKLA